MIGPMSFLLPGVLLYICILYILALYLQPDFWNLLLPMRWADMHRSYHKTNWFLAISMHLLVKFNPCGAIALETKRQCLLYPTPHHKFVWPLEREPFRFSGNWVICSDATTTTTTTNYIHFKLKIPRHHLAPPHDLPLRKSKAPQSHYYITINIVWIAQRAK